MGDARHGAQNVGDGASKATLENEFGTSNEDECMTKILENGTIQSTEVGSLYILTPSYSTAECGLPFLLQTSERQGSKNDSMGTRQAH